MKARIWGGLLAGALALAAAAGPAAAQSRLWVQPPMSYSSLSYYTGALTPWGYFPGSIPRIQIIPDYYYWNPPPAPLVITVPVYGTPVYGPWGAPSSPPR